MKKVIANAIQGFLGRRGYKISKFSFHQENEIDLRLLLARQIEHQKGTISVVQIGANDGVTNDPIHHLVKSRGWSLLAVEPLAPAFERLTNNYKNSPNVTCVQCAVAASDSEMTLYTLSESGDGNNMHDQIASFSLDVLKHHWRHIPDLEKRIVAQSVPAVTFATLTDKYHLDTIDMLQIDTEGFDYEIIKMAFAAGFTPPILAFEWQHLGAQTMWDCRCVLIEKGYRWLVSKGDVIAAHESLLSGL